MGIQKIYTKIINTGTNQEIKNSEVKRIKILNTYALIWINLALFFVLVDVIKITTYYYAGKGNIVSTDTIVAHIITAFFQMIVLYLNKIHCFKFARFFFLVIAFTNFTIFTLIIDPGKYIEYYFVFMSGLALAIFKKNTIPFIVLLLSFLIFLTPYYFYVVYPPDYIKRLLVIASFCIFLCIYLLVNYFKKQNSQNETLLKRERDKVIAEKTIIEKKESELRELNEFKTHFFVNFSHEIRTPLTLIQGNASRINLKASTDENQEKINTINNQVTHIQSILNSIVDLTKIDSDEFTLNRTAVPLKPFLEKHFLEFKELFQKKEIQFDLKMDKLSVAVIMDDNLMSKSINNLLSNALKFTPKNGVVTISCSLDNDLKISITDNGIGIPEYDLENVFERFFQSKNDITKSQGSGIGLSFTQSIVAAHDFTISLDSVPNVATTFTLTIPKSALEECSIQTDTVSNTSIQPKSIDQYKGQHTNRSILIVDDNEEMRAYLKEVLEYYHITEAENGQEALEILQNKTFDIIITDYMMPVLDGEGFVLKVKEKEINTPIIVLTARSDEEGRLKMLRLGIDGYLNKPFNEEELHLNLKKSLNALDSLHSFESTLETEEKESLTLFANKFNQDLNAIICQNLHSPIFGVEDIAHQMQISKSTLNRKTKAILGQTTQELIMEARFQKAYHLLFKNPYATKKEIAQSVGITNATYFFTKYNERFEKSDSIV